MMEYRTHPELFIRSRYLLLSKDQLYTEILLEREGDIRLVLAKI
jgi:hypothetical protein